MRLFDGRGGLHANADALNAAEAYAAQGGQALHVWDPKDFGEMFLESPKTPLVFKRSTPWAHLFDNDAERLEATVRRLGVNVVVMEYRGKHGQHVDLCAGPLRKPMAECVPADTEEDEVTKPATPVVTARFGHHPDPVDDFCIEVDAIEGLEADVNANLQPLEDLRAACARALTFTAGVNERAIAAKHRLCEVGDRVAARLTKELPS